MWPALLDGIEVHTPDAAFDALVNRWLPYQSIVCRLWARAGFYQAGGASASATSCRTRWAVADRAPALLRRRSCCMRHASSKPATCSTGGTRPAGAGVRTHISDDRLWLPLALAHHLARQGDARAARRKRAVPAGPAVPEGREDLYNVPEPAASRPASTNMRRAPSTAAWRTGAHGLPLMGSGDWNDGMNRVGHQGRGESVWLGWFVCHVIDSFAPWAERRGEHARAARWRERARLDRGAGRVGLGRPLVPPRLLRRWLAAGFGRQRRMPHRPDRPGLGGAAGAGDAERARPRMASARRAPVGRRRGRDAPARPAAGAGAARRRLHPGLPAAASAKTAASTTMARCGR